MITFTELIDTHFAQYMDAKQLRPSTRDGYRSCIKWIRPAFASKKVGEVTPSDVTAFMQGLATHGLSGQYRKNIFGLLTLLFELARTYDFIVVTPIRPMLHKPSVSRSEKPTFPVEKGQEFMAAVPAEYRALVSTLFLTGMRQGELLGLRWADVNFREQKILKANIVYRGQLIEGLKNTRNSGRLKTHEIGMSPALVAVLEGHKDSSSFDSDSDFVFADQMTGKPVDPCWFRAKVLYPALAAAGIPKVPHGSGLHMFRHTVVSEVSKRLGIRAAQEQAGHADIGITAAVYTHTDASQRAASAGVLDTAFGFVTVS